MAGLTYVFAHLGPSPLEQAFAAEPEPVSEPSEPAPTIEAPAPAIEPSPAAAPELTASEAETPTPLLAEAARDEPAPAAAKHADRPVEASKSVARLEPSPTAAPAIHEPLPDLPLPAFPEFTDSSRPQPRERGADGPRIDGLFEPSRQAPPSAPSRDASAPADTKPEPRRPLTSCEAAVARNNEQLEIGAPRGPADITREAYASILQNGRYLADCRVPERTVVEICAAVKQGRAVGVTVVTNPPSAALAACVRGRVAGLTFPTNERLDVTHTRFDAASR
jgi:hypothetical protein